MQSLAVFTIAVTALVVCAIVRIHLIGAIVVIRSVSRIVRVVLIRVVVKLTTGMSITGYTFSFAHDINLLVSSDFIITQDSRNRHEQLFKSRKHPQLRMLSTDTPSNCDMPYICSRLGERLPSCQ